MTDRFLAPPGRPPYIRPADFANIPVSVEGPRFPKRSLAAGVGTVARRPGSSQRYSLNIKIQGLNTLIEHFDAIAELTPQLVWSVTNYAGELVVQEGKARVRVDTGATQRSIHHNMFTDQEGIGMEAGPTTFYSPFLEFGTVRMGPFPFMFPAADIVAGDETHGWINAMIQIAGMADQLQTIPPPYDADDHTRQLITRLRSRLYSYEKALGDISVLGGRSVISPFRGGILALARALGDLTSAMSGTINQRLVTRLRGQITGRAIGAGHFTIAGSREYSSFPGGAAGSRVYQRLLGRYSGVSRGMNF